MNQQDDYDDPLLQRLRALPSERLPPAAVWQRIAADLQAVPRSQPTLAATLAAQDGAPLRRHARPRWPRYAVAAALVLAVTGIATIWLLPQQPPAAVAAVEASPLQLQANTITYQYRQAMAAMPQDTLPAELQPALRELDESAGSIRSAIAQSPDAGFLLGQLQRTYALRLELTRKGLTPTGFST